ncbi:B3/B4 domain-containing protein [Kingella oralis]|uniref:B3/B4 domain-containing protein n=1 Tax=Kingella oralis TaxID=505 RepID=UPI0034E40B0C
MEIIVDSSMAALGITDVVLGIARNLDPAAPLGDVFEQQWREREQWALHADVDEMASNPVVAGYTEMLGKVGRSAKKNPPTILALLKNIQRRGNIPRVNSIVDIYNLAALQSLLAIGAHDFCKVAFPLTFAVCGKEDTFLPIASTAKHVAESDFVYRDTQGIMAWLDVRDSEHYKLDEHTQDVLFVIQGNAQTSVAMRLDALACIEADLKACMPLATFETQVVHVAG